jgi:hypothetical protein
VTGNTVYQNQVMGLYVSNADFRVAGSGQPAHAMIREVCI